MLSKLIEAILARIIEIMVHKQEILTRKERAAQDAYISTIEICERKTKHPVIAALIGLVGSGKSSVAKELAGHIGATIVEGDGIRIELRKQNEGYERARAIAENTAIEIISRGSNVIIDSDFIDAKKRASLREKARKADIRLVFICTYAELDVMIGRALTARYQNRTDDFFGGASSKWQGNEQSKGATVKIREMIRRMPLHYRWKNIQGGEWVIKNPPCAVLANIDTTNPEEWKREVEKCAKKLIWWAY